MDEYERELEKLVDELLPEEATIKCVLPKEIDMPVDGDGVFLTTEEWNRMWENIHERVTKLEEALEEIVEVPESVGYEEDGAGEMLAIAEDVLEEAQDG